MDSDKALKLSVDLLYLVSDILADFVDEDILFLESAEVAGIAEILTEKERLKKLDEYSKEELIDLLKVDYEDVNTDDKRLITRFVNEVEQGNIKSKHAIRGIVYTNNRRREQDETYKNIFKSEFLEMLSKKLK